MPALSAIWRSQYIVRASSAIVGSLGIPVRTLSMKARSCGT